MIELTFSDSSAGSLKFAKSMKYGDKLQGAVAVIGGTKKDRREARKPRVWTGSNMEGSPKDVCPLSLYLDIGELSDNIDDRHEVLERLYGRYDGVSEQVATGNRQTLDRLLEAKDTNEPIRMWASDLDPAELCGLYFVCDLLRDANAPLSVVFTNAVKENGSTITQYRSTGEIPAEVFGDLVVNEKTIHIVKKRYYSDLWRELVRENAPLRALVNGRIMSVPENFYDFALRANMSDGEFVVAKIIGKTLSELSGVGDAWLYLRLLAMVEAGELKEIAPPRDDHPYSGILCYVVS